MKRIIIDLGNGSTPVTYMRHNPQGQWYRVNTGEFVEIDSPLHVHLNGLVQMQ